MPGGQRLRGDVAVALVGWVTFLVDWAMCSLGKLGVGAGFSEEGPGEPQEETQQNRLKLRGS